MIFHKVPQKVQQFARYLVLAASITLFAIAANAGSYGQKASKNIVETASGNGVIHVIDEVILPN